MNVLLMNNPSDNHMNALKAAAPHATFLIAKDEASAADLIKNAEVVMGNRYFLQSLPFAEKLKWMQSNSMGVDRILSAGTALQDITLTCVRGVYDDEMADHALALVLALTRGIHLARDDQAEQRWGRRQLTTLSGSRALILGWGGVGQAIARRLAAFGVQVEAVRRSHQGAPQQDATGFVVRGLDSWREKLPNTDILILALPLTKETHHLVGSNELLQLPSGSMVINVGRGATLVEKDVLSALRSDHLLGAALDVVEQEPLPQHDPLWLEPKLLITPHVGRSLELSAFRWESLFAENLRRYANGEPLLNVVDREAGY
ncbi:D-2-hydroxyacid dehydrogenase [Candidatus Pristimantibacillus sp. PTI5]|uniref:D-2-hydroxyacid dehydrogenase n=1 Tax=Candidatus Pristimantibacillus sp. PTI5 TaxID=3400422 RepID=UPI003B015B75